jgi:hypothetical protein
MLDWKLGFFCLEVDIICPHKQVKPFGMLDSRTDPF